MLEVHQDTRYEPGGRWIWSAWVAASPSELDAIDFVQYRLPHDFVNPVWVTRHRADAFRVEERGTGRLRYTGQAAIRHRQGEVVLRELPLELAPPDAPPFEHSEADAVQAPEVQGYAPGPGLRPSRTPAWRPDLEADRRIAERLLKRWGAGPEAGVDGRPPLPLLAQELPKLLMLARRLAGGLWLDPERLAAEALQREFASSAFAAAAEQERCARLRAAMLDVVRAHLAELVCSHPSRFSSERDMPAALEALSTVEREICETLLQAGLKVFERAGLPEGDLHVFREGADALAAALVRGRSDGFLHVLDDLDALEELVADEMLADPGPDLPVR